MSNGNQNTLRNMTVGDLEATWRSLQQRALRETDWLASSRLGQAAREIETAIGEALVGSGVVNDTVEATAGAAGAVLAAGGSVAQTAAAATTDAAASAPSLVQQGIAAATEASNLGVNALVGGAAGYGAGMLLGSKSPFAVGLLGAVVGILFRPVGR